MHCNLKAARPRRRGSRSGLVWPVLYCACAQTAISGLLIKILTSAYEQTSGILLTGFTGLLSIVWEIRFWVSKRTQAKHIRPSDYRRGGLFNSLSRLFHIRWHIAACIRTMIFVQVSAVNLFLLILHIVGLFSIIACV